MYLLIYNKSNILQDIEIQNQDKSFLMLGSAGKSREINIVSSLYNDGLIVFIGLGLGHAIEEYIEKTKDDNTKIAIIDKEDFIKDNMYSSALQAIFENPRVTIIHEKSMQIAMKKLLLWRQENGNLKFEIYYNSQYTRIDKEYYKAIEKQISIANNGALFGQIKLKPFTKKPYKILFLAKNGMIDELAQACDKIQVEYRNITSNKDEFNAEKYANDLLEMILTFRPDMILTINHLGIDQEGAIIALAKKLSLPIASIIVDNPYIMLSPFRALGSEIINIFTYDKDTVPLLKEMGYINSDYLPLGTSSLFTEKNYSIANEWENEVSFVGSTLYDLVAQTYAQANLPTQLQAIYKDIAHAFIKSPKDIVKDFICTDFPEILPLFESMSASSKLLFEKLIIWQSTSQYRLDCVQETFDFDTVLVGDSHWKEIVGNSNKKCRYIGGIPYSKIGDFYASSKINFNATSTQMKNAVNQRVFDVPANNAFLITDWRAQMDELMESGKELISYKEKEEIPDLIKYYLKHDDERKSIAQAGRKRVLAEHTWEKRIEKIINIMSKRYM